MNEHRRQILDMLSQGKITADEAERLIAALDKGNSAEVSGTMGHRLLRSSSICECWSMPTMPATRTKGQ